MSESLYYFVPIWVSLSYDTQILSESYYYLTHASLHGSWRRRTGRSCTRGSSNSRTRTFVPSMLGGFGHGSYRNNDRSFSALGTRKPRALWNCWSWGLQVTNPMDAPPNLTIGVTLTAGGGGRDAAARVVRQTAAPGPCPHPHFLPGCPPPQSAFT